jgi:hypothetical protein
MRGWLMSGMEARKMCVKSLPEIGNKTPMEGVTETKLFLLLLLLLLLFVCFVLFVF